MSGRMGPVVLVLLILSAAFCAGCFGVASLEGDRFAPEWVEEAYLALEATEPGEAAFAANALPAAKQQSIHANGVVWLGFNLITAESGDLGIYDGGQGGAFGIAFGNGQDIKRFFEFGFVETKHHEVRNSSGTIIGDVNHNRFFVGARRYLLPVTGTRSRTAPFVVGGLEWNNMENTGQGGTSETDLSSAFGLGVYVGTGIEIYFTPQLALCLDMRATWWSWEGVPVNTGEQSTAGSSLSIVYHF